MEWDWAVTSAEKQSLKISSTHAVMRSMEPQFQLLERHTQVFYLQKDGVLNPTKAST